MAWMELFASGLNQRKNALRDLSIGSPPLLGQSRPSLGLAGPRVELGAERESLLQVLDENANFGG